MKRITRCLLATVPLLIHCTGDISRPVSPESGGRLGTSSGELCEAAAEAPTPLRRLTKHQYRNSVRDLLSAFVPAAQFASVWQEAERAIDELPNDVVGKKQPFATMDSTVSQQHADAYFRVGSAIAQTLTADLARTRAVMGCRSQDSDRQCIDNFLSRFGAQAFRHKLQTAELNFLRDVYAEDGVDPSATRDVLIVALNAPQFLYQVEFGTEAVPGEKDVYELSDYELASRLSLQFWQTTPDAELMAAAEAGELSSDAGYAAVLTGVLEDERAEESLAEFVTEWLELDSLPPLDSAASDPVFQAFVGDDMPTPEVREDMIADVIASFQYHFERGDSFQDWFLSPYSFAREDGLAALYGTPKWDGSGVPPQFPAGTRSGLLTRAALLATGTANTRPIRKGVLIRERILCDAIAPPDANAMNVASKLLSPTQTTREAVEALTEQPNSTCAGCHTKQINGLGFSTENYDALGRVRTRQRLFMPDGAVAGERPIDTEAKPYVDYDDSRATKDARELAARILEGSKAKECFARQYVRFALGRREDQQDGCALGSVRGALERGLSLKEAIHAFALRREFRRKSAAN